MVVVDRFTWCYECSKLLKTSDIDEIDVEEDEDDE